ncbi:signal recognition particle protein [Deferribacter desulfuricans SSM1]|uniref:Signal recognition particle protein n=1 Tax=Deferribacter desulfuricans (strain DSM 14783 / JCM 11476 / NBRC 101012 / SSM1) TaxID=639282 RepID=D3PAZ0_DEFDS|nr:signal recognition particle protein [Deferribacter desulfuricans]BAI79763.1 signal recognition particle protein [Deferribacter desulfuricans SSM1]
MFATLHDKLNAVFKKIKGQAKITEDNIKDAVKQVRLALLEADVNYKVVKKFISAVQEKALGEEVLKSLTPDQVFIKIVHDELVNVLGGDDQSTKIKLNPIPPTKIMLVGLQGSGKTTTAGKLAKYFQKNGKDVLLVADDIYRPAAIDQLEILGKQLKVDVFSKRDEQDAVKIAKEAVQHAKSAAKDVVIIDTAGRLHIDETLMEELKNIKEAINPDEILFVADAMTGQDAVNVAKTFNEMLDITGVILTKLDGDARGGAALSIREVTGKPLKFVGTGEKLDAFEPFYPDRMASRILGMGDIVTLVEMAQDAIEEDEAEKLATKIQKKGLDFNDMLQQMKMIKKMGSFESILKLLPGFSGLGNIDVDESNFKRIEAIINSMTPLERTNYKILNASRKRRIAKGSGTSVSEVNKLIQQLQQMNKMMKKFKKQFSGKDKIDKNMLKNLFR